MKELKEKDSLPKYHERNLAHLSFLYDCGTGTSDSIIYLLVVLVVCRSYPFHHDVRSRKATLYRRHGLHFQKVQTHVPIPSPGV